MPHVKLTIDGTTHMDGDLGMWVTEPPQILTDQLRDNAQPAPWMKASMLAMADAATTGRDTEIAVQTWPDGWGIKVQHGHHDTTGLA